METVSGLPVRCSSHQEAKAHGVGSEMCRVQKLCAMSLVMWTCQNNLGFSLCAALSICHMVTTSDEWMKSEIEVSADVGVLPLNTRNQVQQKLSLLIIRLANYSVTTSLIYKLDSQEMFKGFSGETLTGVKQDNSTMEDQAQQEYFHHERLDT